MRLIICLSITLTSLMFQGVALANSNEELDDLEFKYMVCDYLENSANLRQAMAGIDDETENIVMTNAQEDILEELEDEDLEPEEYCLGLEY